MKRLLTAYIDRVIGSLFPAYRRWRGGVWEYQHIEAPYPAEWWERNDSEGGD